MSLAKIRLEFNHKYPEEHRAAIVAAVRTFFGHPKPERPFSFLGEVEEHNGKVREYNYGEAVVELDAMPYDAPFEILEREKPRGELPNMNPTAIAFNPKVNVVVPDVGLLKIDHVRAVYDPCTDALQEMLKAGWRIVAVCPQPDQRRPDYILGRCGPESES